MSTDLKGFMVRLAIDPARYAEFLADPFSAAEQQGLSGRERDILLSGDQNKIYSALVDETPA